jgi:hypothetical protein
VLKSTLAVTLRRGCSFPVEQKEAGRAMVLLSRPDRGDRSGPAVPVLIAVIAVVLLSRERSVGLQVRKSGTTNSEWRDYKKRRGRDSK